MVAPVLDQLGARLAAALELARAPTLRSLIDLGWLSRPAPSDLEAEIAAGVASLVELARTASLCLPARSPPADGEIWGRTPVAASFTVIGAVGAAATPPAGDYSVEVLAIDPAGEQALGSATWRADGTFDAGFAEGAQILAGAVLALRAPAPDPEIAEFQVTLALRRLDV